MKNFTDWQLEQYVLAELPSSQIREIQKLAQVDEALRARINAIHESNRALLRDLPEASFATIVTNELAMDNASKGKFEQTLSEWLNRLSDFVTPRKLTAFASVAFTAFFIAFLAPGLIVQSDITSFQTNDDAVRIKGLQPHIKVYRLNKDSSELISVTDALSENDVIQISYIAAGHKFGYIVSVDGNNIKTVHLADAGVAASLEADGEARLATGYKLDDAPGFERFFFISSPERFNLTHIDAALDLMISNNTAQQGQLILAQPLEQSFSINSITFIKAFKEK